MGPARVVRPGEGWRFLSLITRTPPAPVALRLAPHDVHAGRQHRCSASLCLARPR